MADVAQAQNQESGAPEGAVQPQIDVASVSLEQLDELMTKGTASLPMVVSGEGEAGESGAAGESGPAESGPAETGATGATGPAESGAVETGAAETGETGPAETGATGPDASGATGPTASGPEEEKGDRFRYSNPDDRAINALYKAREKAGSPISWAEAERLVKGEAQTGATGATGAAAVDYTEVVSTLTTEVADIEKQLDEAGANEGVFDGNIAKLVRELANKQADLKLAQRDLRQQTERAEADARTAASQSEQARTKSKARAIQAYGPECADESTPFGAAVAKRINEMQNPHHPDHAILFADSAPWQVVRDVADELKIQPKKPAAETGESGPAIPPAKPPLVPAKSKVLPPSGAKTSVLTVQPQEDAKKYVEHLRNDSDVTLEELDAVMEPGGPGKTLQTLVG